MNVEIKSNIDDNELSELYRTSNYYLTTSIIEAGLGKRSIFVYKIICMDTEVNREASRNSAVYNRLECYEDIDKATNLQDRENILSELREIELSNQLMVEWIYIKIVCHEDYGLGLNGNIWKQMVQLTQIN